MKEIRSHIFLLTLVALLSLQGTGNAQRNRRPTEAVQASANRSREAEFYFTEGEKFFILEDYAKALTYYQKTLEIAPDNATVHYKIAEVLMQNERPEDLQKAAVSIENALRLEKKNKYFYLLGANIYASLARFDKAAQTYEKLIANIPGSEEYLYELGAVYQFAGKWEDAIRTYQRAEDVLGVNEVSSVQKQRIYLEQGKIKEAVAEGEKLIAAYPGDEGVLMGFTEVLSQQGLKTEAIRYLEAFAAENKDAVNTRMLLAAFYRENNQEMKARPILLALFGHPDVEVNSKLLILEAYRAELAIARSQQRTDVEKFSFAKSLFTRLLEVSPDDSKVHIAGGDLYMAGGDRKLAHEQYKEAISKGDVTYEVWENLLSLEYQLGYRDELVRNSDRVLEIFPNQGKLHFYNGCGYLLQQKYDEALAAFQQAMRLSSSNVKLQSEINGKIGEAYHGMQRFEQADQAFTNALAQDPGNSSVLNGWSTCLVARKTNLDKAEKMAEQLVRNDPLNPDYLNTYARVLDSRGKLKEARKIMERAVSTAHPDAGHLEYFGDILFKLGEIDAAVVQWEKAKGLNGNNELLNRKIANRKIYE